MLLGRWRVLGTLSRFVCSVFEKEEGPCGSELPYFCHQLEALVCRKALKEAFFSFLVLPITSVSHEQLFPTTVQNKLPKQKKVFQ